MDKSSASVTQKKSTFIRWEAIIPVAVITLLIIGYFHFLFDRNLKSGLETAGYHIVGAQVDIANLRSNFLDASISIEGIDMTDSDKPSLNSISIGSIRYAMRWDALLRGKFLIEEASVNDIAFGKPRPTPGKVKPPEPPPPPQSGPSAIEKESNKVKSLALNQIEDQYNQNIFGDLAAILGGQTSDSRVQNISDKIKSKALAEKIQIDIETTKKKWEDKLTKLPNASEFSTLGERLKKVKLKDFNSPQELEASLKELDAIFKEADGKLKAIEAAHQELTADLQAIDQAVKDLDRQIKDDTKTLEAHFKIPSIDAKTLGMSVLGKYLSPWIKKYNHYYGLADKYVPPNLMKKGTNEPDESIQPRPREKGISYEFPRKNSYPTFWIKKIAISSQAGTSPYSGNIRGQILDISSNQVTTQKPMVAQIEGGFPSAGIGGLKTKLEIDNRRAESKIDFDFKIDSMSLAPNQFVSNEDVQIGYQKASSQLNIQANLIGLKKVQIGFNNKISDLDYQIEAKNPELKSALQQVFKDMPFITLEANMTGTLPDVSTDIQTNLGESLRRGIEKQVQVKIDALKKQLSDQIEAEVGKLRKQVESQSENLKKSTAGELKKVQDSADEQKRLALEKSDSAKKGAENSAKKKFEEEGKKAADELKKRLGL